jgi:hypothetical protein
MCGEMVRGTFPALLTSMLVKLSQGLEAASEMLQRLCCAALLGSPAVALIEASNVDEGVLREVAEEPAQELH